MLTFHERLLADYGGSAGVRDEGLLDSALSQATKPARLWPSRTIFFDLAASYAFGIVGNHPFIDGNKNALVLSAAAVFRSTSTVTGQLIAPETDATAKTLQLGGGRNDRSGICRLAETKLPPHLTRSVPDGCNLQDEGGVKRAICIASPHGSEFLKAVPSAHFILRRRWLMFLAAHGISPAHFHYIGLTLPEGAMLNVARMYAALLFGFGDRLEMP